MPCVALVGWMKVPKNIWGRINMNESPTAAPDDFDIEAVIRPSPTEHSDNNNIKINAIKNPFGRKPINRENRKTITSWITAIIIFVMI